MVGALRFTRRAGRIPELDMDDLSAPTPSPWQATRFEVRTRLETLDYLQAMRVVRWKPIERIVAWLSAVGMCGIGAIAVGLAADPLVKGLPAYAYWDWDLAAAITGALLGLVVYYVFVLGPYMDSMFEGQPIGMGETTIVADANGVAATSIGIETRVPWTNVLDVITTNEHLFLMYGRVVGVIIPRRGFADDGEAQRFADFVRSKTSKSA